MTHERTILIRCDASAQIGQGHVARCAALAHALRDCGARPVFVACDEPLARERLGREGFELLLLPAPAPEPRAALPAWDATRTLELARSSGAETVIVDHYGARDAWLRRAASAGMQLGVIDDEGDRDLSAADFILNPGASDDAASSAPRRNGQLLLFGPRYALVHPAFPRARAAAERIEAPGPGHPLKVLVTVGGGGVERAAAVIEALGSVGRPIEIRCTAAQPPAPESPLAALAAASRHRCELVAPCTDLAPHATWAEIAVCGAGATCFELCCVGVPLIAVALAGNQQGNLRALRRAGAAMCLGDWNGCTAREIAAFVRTLAQQHELRRELSLRARRLVDGLGGERAARAILQQARRLEGAPA